MVLPSVLDASPVSAESLRQTVRAATRAMAAIRAEALIPQAIESCRVNGWEPYEGVDDVVNAYEAAEGRLPIAAWRLLREMVTGEFHLFLLARDILRGGA